MDCERILLWESYGQAKIVVKAPNEQTLLDLEKRAKELKIPTGLIEDDGLTQVKQGTLTCIAIGPGNKSI